MQASQHTFRRRIGVVVVNEMPWNAEIREAGVMPGLGKKPPLIGEAVGRDQDDLGNREPLSLHRFSSFNLALRQFEQPARRSAANKGCYDFAPLAISGLFLSPPIITLHGQHCRGSPEQPGEATNKVDRFKAMVNGFKPLDVLLIYVRSQPFNGAKQVKLVPDRIPNSINLLLARLLGVRHAITPRTMDPPPGWRIVADDRSSRLIENPHAVAQMWDDLVLFSTLFHNLILNVFYPVRDLLAEALKPPDKRFVHNVHNLWTVFSVGVFLGFFSLAVLLPKPAYQRFPLRC